MPGLADLLYLGQPDPARQLALALSGQQAQPQAGPGQGPAPPNGPPPADGAGAPQNNVAPGNPGPGAPTAYASTPDQTAANQQLANPPNLMSLYLQLDQRNRAEDQMNRGFALIAANHSSPSMREAIMQSVGGGVDAGQEVNSLMNLYGAQQQVAGQQGMLAQAADWDQKLGLPPGTSRSMILAGRGSELVKELEPTTKTRDIEAEHDLFIKNGGSEEDWKSTYLPLILTGGIAGATPDTRSRTQELIKWKNDPANQGRPPPSYLTDDTKWKLYNTDLSDAKTQFNGMNDTLGRFIDTMGEVSSSKELDSLAGHPVTGGGAAAFPTSEAYQLYKKMQGLGDTAKDMASRGGPKGVGQNIKTLGSSPEAFTDLGITDYRGDVIAPRMRQALTAQANAYGAAGRLNEMPSYLKPYLDQMYAPGGDLDPGGGFKPFTTNKDLKQPDAEAIAQFRGELERFGPKVALANLEKHGYDSSSLR